MEPETDIRAQIYKQPFGKPPNRTDGLMLKIHHTAPGQTGDIRRVRFKFAAFSRCNEVLAIADHRGDIAVVDLSNNVYWIISEKLSISVLCFHSQKRYELWVGTKNCDLLLLNSETGHQLGCLRGHTEAPSQLSFNSDGNFCLSVSCTEGFIWDVQTLKLAHRLNLKQDMTLKQAVFMPVSDNILACFKDDAIHVWAFPSFQFLKRVVPDEWEGCSIKTIAFTRNGRALALGGTSRQLVVFSDLNVNCEWNAQRIVQLPDFVSKVQHLEFLPESFDSGANQVLMVLTSCGEILFADLLKGTVMQSKSERCIGYFTCSWSGKYVVCNTVSGEAKIFLGAKLMTNIGGCFDDALRVAPPVELASAPEIQPKTKHSRGTHSRTHVLKRSKPIQVQPLNISRLRLILKEYSMYPSKYRSLIWRSILQLPGNKGPWESLCQRPLHASAQKLSEIYPLQNRVMFDCLQSVISCLAHWSPVFGELPYLPQFLFPFIKVFHSDHFLCFEVAATLLVNWCQHWFDYLAFPPVNILGMVENILAEHDMGLIKVFTDAGVTTRLYAWTLLSSAFSEVLSTGQWKELWDHILTNPPWFLLFAVVAYNISCRDTLKACSSTKDFEFFFKNQNPIDMGYFVKKCYKLMDKTSVEYHPSQHFKEFCPLNKGNYPVFSDFPEFIVNYQNEQRGAIRREEKNILKEQHRILSQRLACEELCMRERNARAHEALLLEAEKAANVNLQAEVERLMEKRRQLAALRRELEAQEKESLAAARVEMMEHELQLRSAELDRLQRQVYGMSGIDLNEEAILQPISRIKMRRRDLLHCMPDDSYPAPDDELTYIMLKRRMLSEEIQKLQEKGWKGMRADEINSKMANLDSLQQKVEDLVARKANLKREEPLINSEHREQSHTAAQIKKLEREVEELTQKLSALRNSEDPHAKCKSEKSERKLLNLDEPKGCLEPPQAAGTGCSLRSTELYKKEKCAVSSAMDLRRSLLSDWQNI